MSRSPALVILAAGLGRRFGGLKQLAPVGPDSEALMDVAAGRARDAGLDPVVLVVRTEIEHEVRAHVSEHWPSDVEVRFVCQDDDPLSRVAAAQGREKPLGTAHAVLVALAALDHDISAVVVNADDLYPADAYEAVAEHLRTAEPPATALVTFALGRTVIGDAPVNRARCVVEDGLLRSITEGSVRREGDGFVFTDGTGAEARVDGDEPVSMNFWALPAGVASALRLAAERFVASPASRSTAELLLPEVALDAFGRPPFPPIRVLPSEGRCIGVTRAEDVTTVRALLAGGGG